MDDQELIAELELAEARLRREANPEHYWPTEEEMERLLAEEAERTPAVCPVCGQASGFSGRVVWCPCSGWVK